MQTIQQELSRIAAEPLIIPLGKAVEEVLHLLITKGIVLERQCLLGFPHPSGANGHRFRQLEESEQTLLSRIDAYLSSL